MRKLGAIVFDVELEFILVQIKDEQYDILTFDSQIDEKYDSIIAIIKAYMDVFGKKMDCWEPVLEFDGMETYTIKTDLEEIDIDSYDDYDIISIEDLNNVDCTPRLKWFTYMCLDRSMRKNKIVKSHE